MILAAIACGVSGLIVSRENEEVIREVIVFSWTDVIRTAWLALALPLLIVGGIFTVFENGDRLFYGRAMLALLALILFCIVFLAGPYLWACAHGYGDRWVFGIQNWLDKILVGLILILAFGPYLAKFARRRYKRGSRPSDSATV